MKIRNFTVISALTGMYALAPMASADFTGLSVDAIGGEGTFFPVNSTKEAAALLVLEEKHHQSRSWSGRHPVRSERS